MGENFSVEVVEIITDDHKRDSFRTHLLYNVYINWLQKNAAQKHYTIQRRQEIELTDLTTAPETNAPITRNHEHLLSHFMQKILHENFQTLTCTELSPTHKISADGITKVFQRHIVVGDIHGNWHGLQVITYNAQLLDNRGHWMGDNDVLILLGDTIDRVLGGVAINDHLDILGQEALVNGGKVIRILGNHEWTLLILLLAETNPIVLNGWLNPGNHTDVVLQELNFPQNIIDNFKFLEQLRPILPILSAEDANAHPLIGKIIQLVVHDRNFRRFIMKIANNILSGNIVASTAVGGRILTHAAISPELVNTLLSDNEDITTFSDADNVNVIDPEKLSNVLNRRLITSVQNLLSADPYQEEQKKLRILTDPIFDPVYGIFWNRTNYFDGIHSIVGHECFPGGVFREIISSQSDASIIFADIGICCDRHLGYIEIPANADNSNNFFDPNQQITAYYIEER
ncbi:MAG: metallophosphoesterase [Oligoflexia bacterium]|nr:metallophosphoesterase [Oligoflexia bacterium]